MRPNCSSPTQVKAFLADPSAFAVAEAPAAAAEEAPAAAEEKKEEKVEEEESEDDVRLISSCSTCLLKFTLHLSAKIYTSLTLPCTCRTWASPYLTSVWLPL